MLERMDREAALWEQIRGHQVALLDYERACPLRGFSTTAVGIGWRAADRARRAASGWSMSTTSRFDSARGFV